MSINPGFLNFLCQSLENLKKQNLHRELQPIRSCQGPWVQLGGQRLLNLCSNNYLGLSFHPRVMAAASDSLKRYGCGSGASRLVCGNSVLHELLEQKLASFKGQEAALLFNSGYNANLGVISALANSSDCIFSDELNHASIIDGCRLSRARVEVFPHKDVEALERKLQKFNNSRGKRFIVTDAIFSMDGDLAPLPELVSLAEQYECILIVDEAHATGTLGPGGKGLIAYYGLEEHVPVTVGTLSKALGCFGAFIAGNLELREYLINLSRSFIYTTSLPPMVLSSALEALRILEENPDLVEKLQQNASYLRIGLKKSGYKIKDYPSPIIPLILGEADRALKLSELLKQEGLLVTAIRPPTVPEGSSRIRITVTTRHSREDLDFALNAFEKVNGKN